MNVPGALTVLGLAAVLPSLHVSVPVAPVTVSVDVPSQLFVTASVGAGGGFCGAAVTELLAALVHPPTVWVTVNVPGALTVLGLAAVLPSLQVSVPVAPVTVRVDVPSQLFVTASVGAGGGGFTVTVTCAVLLQLADVPVTVYVVVVVGLAVTVVPVAGDNPVVGNQL